MSKNRPSMRTTAETGFVTFGTSASGLTKPVSAVVRMLFTEYNGEAQNIRNHLKTFCI